MTFSSQPRALKSPQILELSGIGKKDVLESVHVPVVVDLPGVGENMQEHVCIGVTFGELSNPSRLHFVGLNLLSELKDDVDFDTVDLLRDPEAATEHLKL